MQQRTFPCNYYDYWTMQIPTLPAPVIGTPAAKAPVAVDADAGELAELESLFWSWNSIRGFFFSVDKKECIQ